MLNSNTLIYIIKNEQGDELEAFINYKQAVKAWHEWFDKLGTPVSIVVED